MTETALIPAPSRQAVAETAPIALYVHWPFCAAKCPYCDFNSHVRSSVDHGAWREALVRELAYFAGLTGPRLLTSIFFGGGTPSLMEPATTATVIDAAFAHFNAAPDCEITLEANPTSVEASRFEAFREAGVNRVSLGLQALNDADLAFLGRQHSAAEGLAAVSLARAHFERVSFDLIYARPDQQLDAWQAELARAVEAGCDHLSLYQLTIEEGTPFFAQHARGDFTIPDDEAGGALYEATQSALEALGMPAYEISNHAQPGQESRHNLTYWRYGDYIGIGPGAHGRLTLDAAKGVEKVATRTHRAPEIWLRRALKDGHGAHPFEPLETADQVAELLMMGLRLTEGVPTNHLNAVTFGKTADFVDMAELGRLAEAGFIEASDSRISATATGRQRLNQLLPRLLI